MKRGSSSSSSSSNEKKFQFESSFLDLTTRELVQSVYGKDSSCCALNFKDVVGNIHTSADLRVCFIANGDLSSQLQLAYGNAHYQTMSYDKPPFRWEVKQQEFLYIHTPQATSCDKSPFRWEVKRLESLYIHTLNYFKKSTTSTNATYYLTITKLPNGVLPNMRVFLTYNGVITEVDYQEQVKIHQADQCSDHAYIYGTLKVIPKGCILFMPTTLGNFKISDLQSLKTCHQNISSHLKREFLHYHGRNNTITNVYPIEQRGLAIVPLTETMLDKIIPKKLEYDHQEDLVFITANRALYFPRGDSKFFHKMEELVFSFCCYDNWLHVLGQLPALLKANNPYKTRIIIYSQDLVATKLITLPPFLINCTWDVLDYVPVSKSRKTDIPIPHNILAAIGPHCEFRFWSNKEPLPHVFNKETVTHVLLDPASLTSTIPFISVKEDMCVSFKNRMYKSPSVLATRLFEFIQTGSQGFNECRRWKFYEENADVLDALIFSLTRTHEGWVRELIHHFARMHSRLYDESDQCDFGSLLTMLITAPQFRDFHLVNLTHERCKLLKGDMTFIDPILPVKSEDYLAFKLRKKGFISDDDSKMHYHNREKFRDLFPHGDDVYEAVTLEDGRIMHIDIINHQPLAAFLFDGTPCLLLPKTNNKVEVDRIIKFIDNIQEIMYYKLSLPCKARRRDIHLMKMAYAILKLAIENKMTENEEVDCMLLYLMRSCKPENPFQFSGNTFASTLFFLDDHERSIKSLTNVNTYYDLEFADLDNARIFYTLKMSLILSLLKFSTKTFQEMHHFQPPECIIERFHAFGQHLGLYLKGQEIHYNRLQYPIEDDDDIDKTFTPTFTPIFPTTFDCVDKIIPFIETLCIYLNFKKRREDDYTCTCCVHP